MFEKITGKIADKYFSKRAIKAQAETFAKSSLQAVKPKTQKAVLHWLDRVAEIKDNLDLDQAGKRQKLHKLETSEVVAKFVRTLVNQFADKLPGKRHGLEKFGRVGTKVASTSVALTKIALPSFIMSSRFDTFADFVRGTFSVQDPLDHHIPVPQEEIFQENLVAKRSQQKMKTKVKMKPPVRHSKPPRAQANRGH